MTPATQPGIWSHGRWVRPRDTEASEDTIRWASAWANEDEPSFDLDDLLDDYCELVAAQPEEMARFVEMYGVPELKSTRVTTGRESNPMGWAVQSQRAGAISVRDLRSHARGVAAARRLAAALVSRRPGDRKDWSHTINNLTPLETLLPRDHDFLDDWKLGRETFSMYLTEFLRQAEVSVRADWLGARRLSLEPDAGTFLGMIAVLLARDVGAEGEYACDSCGRHVARTRPPRSGERVYCDRVECKREQQRRNQAAWRARKAEKS